MKKCRKYAAAICVLAVLLSGCGWQGEPDSVDMTTIVVDKSGRVTYYLVGDFDKDYYSLSELTSMAEEEAAEFNKEEASGEGQAVTVAKAEPLQGDESKVTVTYVFDSEDSFAAFTGSTLFFGTVNEALSLGHSLDGVLKGVGDGMPRTKEQLGQEGENLLLITDARAAVYCPSKVIGLSSGAELREDGSVDVSQAEGAVYILLK